MNSRPGRIHITGICGVATSAIAIAFHAQGTHVTGSDKGFYPPVSTHLTEAGIPYYAGWHPENIEANGRPDFIMTGGGGTATSNPELIYAREHGIPVYSYAEVLQKYFIRPNSIVTAGTWGKTTTSSLLSFILVQAGMKPSYFTGGLSLSHPTGALSASEWSVVEGDEYQTSISDKRPKFDYYSPTHLLLTSVSWDHADLYPTEEAYFDAFRKLISTIPAQGLIVACADNTGVQSILKEPENQKMLQARRVSYGTSANCDYHYHSVEASQNGISFSITHTSHTWTVMSPMLGSFNAENITGSFAMAHEIGIAPEVIIKATADFKGIKRRFEKRFEGDVTVLDCHAPTAEKAASALDQIREVYPKNIIAVYEPNLGGRQRASAASYADAFKDADKLFIPRLSPIKVAENVDVPMDGQELTTVISQTYSNTSYLEDDTELVKQTLASAKKDDVIVFLGSHGFRGMIEEVVTYLHRQ